MKADEVTDTTAKISWNAVVGYPGGIKEYEVFRDGVSIGTRVGTNLSDSNLEPETEYSYQVKAIGNNDLESELSETVSIITEAQIEEV